VETLCRRTDGPRSIGALPADPGPHERLLTVREVAARLGVCRALVYRVCQRNELPALRIGGALRFFRETVESFVVRALAVTRPPLAPPDEGRRKSSRDRTNRLHGRRASGQSRKNAALNCSSKWSLKSDAAPIATVSESQVFAPLTEESADHLRTLLTVSEGAAYPRVSTATVYELIAKRRASRGRGGCIVVRMGPLRK
jgi:excisionase family DNA binding protein